MDNQNVLQCWMCGEGRYAGADYLWHIRSCNIRQKVASAVHAILIV